MSKYLIILVVTLTSVNAFADESNFEIGAAIGPAFMKNNEVAASVHGHALWPLHQYGIALGVSYESLFDEHRHSTFGFVTQLHIWKGLYTSVSPGITFAAGEYGPSLHLETLYAFEIQGGLHLGPAFEIAFDQHSSHITPALHIGIGF